MSLVINHNLMAENALRNLSGNYRKMSTSIQRLSSGLRINSAADDAAGLAVREMMRADIAVMQQGIRNASDAISLIQTAEGAMAVIDEKLVRMKELAEQAATGTYCTAQRDIINSEYQAMAKEIDRIANATNFAGLKLLDGSLANQNGGQGVKIHFGVGNNADEDYYFINTGDVRATAVTGLRIGGDGDNDIWAQGGAAAAFGGETCCAGGYDSLTGASFESGTAFSFGYNWDLQGPTVGNGAGLVGGKYTAGLWELSSGESLASLISRVNQGTQARVGIRFDDPWDVTSAYMSALGICLGDEIYYLGSASAVLANTADGNWLRAFDGTVAGLVSAINTSSRSFWAMLDDDTAYIFCKSGGAEGNYITACEKAWEIENQTEVDAQLAKTTFLQVAEDKENDTRASFSLGGEKWGTLTASQNGTVWNLVLNGRDIGQDHDLWIANITGAANSTLDQANFSLVGWNLTNGRLLARQNFAEVQNAANAPWAGAEIRTQDSAQKALAAIDLAIEEKDKVRATLGAYQNRLENTITNLEIQAENLQAAESRISDADVAREIVNLTKSSVLVQAATSMVAQANSLNNLALTLLSGR